MTKKGVSIVIPVWNEAQNIRVLCPQLANLKDLEYEVIFVDGGSTDNSISLLQSTPHIRYISHPKGRAQQLNAGARETRFDWLYFLHVDSLLPPDFSQQLLSAQSHPRQAACFRMRFDHPHPLLRLSAALTRINHLSCRGGDQSLLIHRDFFNELGGFDPAYSVCEDLKLIQKIYRKGRFKILPGPLTTQARRFEQNGVAYLLFHFGVIQFLFALGVGPQKLKRYYDRFVR